MVVRHGCQARHTHPSVPERTCICLARPAYPLHLLEPSDGPPQVHPAALGRAPCPATLAVFPLCWPQCLPAGVGFLLKEFLLSARLLPVNITETINPKPCSMANPKVPSAPR